MQESIVFLLHVQCRRKESSRSLSHLLMSFLCFYLAYCATGLVIANTSSARLEVCAVLSLRFNLGIHLA